MSRHRIAVLAVAGLAAPLAAAHLAPGSADAALWRMLAAQAFFAGLAVLLALRLDGSLRERLGLVRGRLSLAQLASGLAGTLALSVALQFAVNAFGLAPGTSLERLQNIAAASLPASPWLSLAAFTLAPAFGEELLCRGAVQRSLARAFGAWAICGSALVFALLHMDFVHSPAALLLGAYLGALAWWSGTTWLPIACHLANNAVATIEQASPAWSGALPRPGDSAEAVVWLVVSLAALGAARRGPSSPQPDRDDSSA